MESARVYGTLAGNRVQTSVLMTREGLVGGSTYVRCGPLDLSVQAAANDSTRWLGAGADGHLGRLNLSVVGWWDGEAALAATELSVDRDWLRLRLSGFHQPEAFVSLAPDPWLVVSSSWHQSGAGAATLLGPGVQAQLLPTLDANADALWTTEGVDLSAGLGFRPLFNQVLVLRADTALLFGDELTPSVRVRGVFSW
jgi:hypothetical protein